MSNYKVFICLLCTLFLQGCTSDKWQKDLVQKGHVTDAINNAITDFVHTSKLSKKDSIFTVSIAENNETCYQVTIAIADNVVLPSAKDSIGAYDPLFPTNYAVNRGNLFYWNDSTLVITQELLSILEKYDHIDYRFNELPFIVGGVHNDGTEGVIYSICKKDLTNYKKTRIKGHFK